jgi:putative ATP-dependent endonuclease of OLD family
MRIKELSIRNFRKIKKLTIVFPPGLAVIVGQNNTGKTTIIDALRLMLFPGRDFDALRINEDDFRQNSDNAPIEISCSFCDLTLTDEARFVECLVKVGEGKFEARLNVRAEFNSASGRPNFKWWGGETEGGSLPSNLYDNISSVYLQPLRDPDSGLRPGQHSQVSRLIRKLTSDAKEQEFIEIAKKSNEEIGKLKPVEAARKAINMQMRGIAGKELMQNTKLVFHQCRDQ